MPSVSAPAPGQLVEVRWRQFVVQDVKGSSLRTGQVTAPQHLVKLSSIEEDAIGDELEVIWEIEPGARILEGAEALPEPTEFDDPVRFDAFLNAVRWGAIDSGDPRVLQSPFRAGIQIEDYQLDPVVRALRMPRVNLLIADDVGLGKTIEAGLVAEEMILRHRVKTILVVCPASMQIQWRDQMQEKFGLEFRIVDSALLKELRRRRGVRVNPWTHFPRLIASIDFLKRDKNMRRIREVLPVRPGYPRKFDLLIVDEAHNVAPARVTRYSTDSDRTRAIRALAPHFEHRLFLSATPHNGYRESFSSLLALLDDQRFAPGIEPEPAQVEQIMVRRLKTDIVDPDGNPRFPKRRVVHLEVEYPAEEREAHAKLAHYSQLREETAKAAAQEKKGKGGKGDGRNDETDSLTATHFVSKLLKKRLFSSPQAFLRTLEEHLKSLRGLRDGENEGKHRRSARLLRRELERSEELYSNEEEQEEALDNAVHVATALYDRLSKEEKELLRDLKDWAMRTSARPDAKAETLLAFLESTCKTDGEWNHERVIVFTEYRDTQKWLHGLLVQAGLGEAERLSVLHGGIDKDERERIKAAFLASPEDSKVRILLATDAASEGIDLQKHCHRMVHYEIPWNPNRLEQRNGRIDRHGQRHEPLVHHFVGRGFKERLAREDWRRPGDLEGDLEFLAVTANKVETIREDLGKVGPVLASQVEEAMLGKREDLDTDRAEREAQAVRKQLRFTRELRERIAALHEQLDESRHELSVDPHSVQSVVVTGLALAGQPPLREAELHEVWPDPTGERTQCPVFWMPELRPPWNRCFTGIEHSHTGRIRPITFDHDVAADRDDVVLVHLNHPLVQMAQRLLRAEVWTRSENRKLHRVTARLVPASLTEDRLAVVAHGRIVVLGGGHHALHEEVIAAGGTVTDGRFARLNVGQTRALLDAGLPDAAPAEWQNRVQEIWPGIRDAVQSALETRMRDRTKTLESRMQERAEQDVQRITEVLQQLEASIRKELAEEQKPEQLELWSDPEREQLERDRDELERRLARIPEEIEQESMRIRAQYAEPRPLLFPVSVTFYVPDSLAR